MTWHRSPGNEKRKPRSTLCQQHCRYCGRLYSQTNAEKALQGFCSMACFGNAHNRTTIARNITRTKMRRTLLEIDFYE